MALINRLRQRQSDEPRSTNRIVLRLLLFAIGGVLLWMAAFTARGEDDVIRDDINEEEVSVAEIPQESIEEEREVRDIPLRPVIYGALTLLGVAIAIHVGLWWLLETWTEEPLRLDAQVPPVMAEIEPPYPDVEGPDFPGPDLQAAPALEYQIYRAAQLEILGSYGRIDGDAAFVRIPIGRAMELLAAEGLPAREGEIPDFGLDPAYELDSEGGQEFDPIWGKE